MRAGELRHTVELHSATESRGASGESINTYAEYATVRASVEALTGRELESAQQISAETKFKITMRYYSGVVTEHRIVFGSRTFEINHIINPQEKNKMLILYCKEVT